MDIKQNKTASPSPERCSFLGLREDPQTALAFPSIWNYCHKVRPPRSVALAYQRDFCQVAACRQCPIVNAEHPRSLPVEARSRNPYGMSPAQSFWLGFLVVLLLILGLWLFWIYFPAANPFGNMSGFLHFSPAENTLPAATLSAPSEVGAAPTLTATSDMPSPEPSSTGSSSSQAVSGDGSVCGYQLDQPINAEYHLVLHRAQSGENLDQYAREYNTTVETILAVNYQLPVPLRIDWVLVIPVQISDVHGTPPLEPYFEPAEGLSLSEAAQMLSLDESKLRKSNGFADKCQTVSGWLLVPRPVAD